MGELNFAKSPSPFKMPDVLPATAEMMGVPSRLAFLILWLPRSEMYSVADAWWTARPAAVFSLAVLFGPLPSPGECVG